MTEEEAKNALFQIHYEYMSHTPKERLKLYDEYQQKRNFIKSELAKAVKDKVEENTKKI